MNHQILNCVCQQHLLLVNVIHSKASFRRIMDYGIGKCTVQFVVPLLFRNVETECLSV